MFTTPADRFATIFASRAKPALPDPSLPHIADTELQKPEPVRPEAPIPFEVPAVPQVKRKSTKPNRQDVHDIISSSEKEDNYVDALKSGAKPTILDLSTSNGGMNRRKAAFRALENPDDAQLDSSAAVNDSNHGIKMKTYTDLNDDDMTSDFKLPMKDADGFKVTGHFCIFSLAAKFPYRYMKDPNDQVSKRFFASNKFYAREWDVYYLHPPETSCGQPIILLPLNQVQQLLNEIGSSFNIDIKLPPSPFTLSFFDGKTPHPVLLGRSRSRDEFNEIQSLIPLAIEGHGEAREMATKKEKRAFEDFRVNCELAQAANKKGKASKLEKKAKERLVAFHEVSAGLRRTQRYLGLRPETKETLAPDPSMSWEDQQKWETEQEKKSSVVLSPLDVTKLAPFPFEKKVVFVGFDVEANEHAHHLITEIGISTLDIHDIRYIQPGPCGENWIKQIRSRHFRIKERLHMRNKTFVHGNPDGFEFGNSEFVDLRDAADEVDKCFAFPFSQGFQHDGKRGLAMTEQPSLRGPINRRVVICGHDVHTDIDYLAKLGSKIFTFSHGNKPGAEKHPVLDSIEEALDVAILYKVLKKEGNTRSLGSLMTDLGREAWGLHNGGNDARYTMECLVGLAIKARFEEDEKAKKQAEENAPVAKQVDESNKAWPARDAKPKKPALFANTDSAEEAAALNAKFLDPAMTSATAVSPAAPGRGGHYGNDDELDEISDDGAEPAQRGVNDAWFDTLVKAADEKLSLQAGDEDDESDFEM